MLPVSALVLHLIHIYETSPQRLQKSKNYQCVLPNLNFTIYILFFFLLLPTLAMFCADREKQDE